MTPEQLGRLFERFYRADPSGAIPGTGLGLTLVKEIAEAMHGSVDVVSEVGHGTAVTLWFPAVASESGMTNGMIDLQHGAGCPG
jgi:signal transduction histidine kinase